MKKRIGFISTRFSGTDGVSLESIKWAEVLEAAGHTCFWFAGESDRPDEVSFMVPQAHFQHPSIQHINERVFGTQKRNPGVTETIHHLRALIKGISSTVIPNVLDYEKAPVVKDDTRRFRSANGFTKEDIIITSSARLKKMTEHNYRAATKYFSYQVLRNRLGVLMAELLREENAPAGINSTALPNNVVTLTEREVRPRRVAQAR